MARKTETLICKKCGKPFIYWSGGIVANPKDFEIRMNPVCNVCKMKKVTSIFKK